ncbi:MAG: 3-deoxy-D-manno-octulosonate 8-phosphate phosphatase [Bacteroidetes bacterium]|nr:MAG: 3-deoxy-D-manno-octulosonate 8-phosphate phosphatase [Bacteroidota bacterium]
MNALENFATVKVFIFDVDGVMTNNEVIVLENGHLLRKMNIRDGFALKTAVQAGFRVVALSGGKSSGVEQRLRALGLREVYLGVDDKLEKYLELLETHRWKEEAILYMGDDLPDLEPMRRVGLPVCPADAAPEIREIARYISSLRGGEGCVRDVVEKVLILQGKWPVRRPVLAQTGKKG